MSGGGLFFNDTATTEIYTLSLHDALPIYKARNSLIREYKPMKGSKTGELTVSFDVVIGKTPEIGRAHV